MVGPGKEQVNLTLNDETIAWLRATAPNRKAIGCVVDDLVLAARMQSPLAKVEKMISQLALKLDSVALTLHDGQ